MFIAKKAAQAKFVTYSFVDEAMTGAESKANITVLTGKMPKLKYYSSEDISSGFKAGSVFAAVRLRLCSAIVAPAAFKVERKRVK